MQSSIREKVKDLIKKGIGIPCIKRVCGVTAMDIINVIKDEEQINVHSVKQQGGVQGRRNRKTKRPSNKNNN